MSAHGKKLKKIPRITEDIFGNPRRSIYRRLLRGSIPVSRLRRFSFRF